MTPTHPTGSAAEHSAESSPRESAERAREAVAESPADGSAIRVATFPQEISSGASGSALDQILPGWSAFGRELHLSGDLDSALEVLAEKLRDQSGADTVAILLLDDRGRELRFRAALGYPDSVVQHWRFGLGQGLAGTAAASGRPIRVDDVEQDERYMRACPSTRSELTLPLLTNERVIGAIVLGSSEPAFFSEAHERRGALVAERLAAAIESRRLYDNVRDQARMLSVLHQVSRELTSILDRPRLLARVAERLHPLIPYDVFSVMRWNAQRARLEPWLALRADGDDLEHVESMELGQGISGAAAALRQSIRVANVAVDPRYIACDRSLGVRSELAVPLVFEDRLIGVLDLESREYDRFSPRHEQLLSTLAPSIAIALANAETYEALLESQRQINDDLDTAREVQKQLLPTATPWLPGMQIAAGYRPARHLGGDFYDFHRYSGQRYAIAVGDVAGKSTSAALYGALAVGMLREVADRGPTPSELLSVMNERLRQLGFKNRFLAMIYGVYDADRKVLTLANSGLPYPFLVRGRSVREIKVHGLPLGLLPASYQEIELELEDGDALVFATDGLDEALNERDEEFGKERIRGTLARLAAKSSREIADGLLEAVERFSGAAEVSDDRTVVVLKACGDCFGAEHAP